MSTKVNVSQLTKTELRARLVLAPAWIKQMPAQAQRRYLVAKYPKHYVIGSIAKGSVAGHIEHRGIWSEKDFSTFEIVMKIKTRRLHRNGVSIDWGSVIPSLVQEYCNA